MVEPKGTVRGTAQNVAVGTARTLRVIGPHS